jgi:hypothetical protein
MRFLVSVIVVLLATAFASGREWRDSTGEFSLEAEYQGVENKNAVLKKLDGSIVKVPISRLSAEDQQYLKKKDAVSQQRRERAEREAIAAAAAADATAKAAAIEQPTGSERAEVLSQASAERIVRARLNKKNVIRKMYPIESMENAFVFLRDFPKWPLRWVPLAQVRLPDTQGSPMPKAIDMRGLTAAKSWWGLRIQFTSDEGFGRTEDCDEVVILDEKGNILGNVLTSDVRMRGPKDVAQWAKDHPSSEKVMDSLSYENLGLGDRPNSKPVVPKAPKRR